MAEPDRSADTQPQDQARQQDQVRAAGILLYYEVNRDPNGKAPRPGNTHQDHDTADRHFLLMRHATRWDLPKGHCDGDETFRETALREMQEETGISTSQVTLDPSFCFELSYPVTYRKSGDRIFEKRVQYFLGRLDVKREIRVTEHESCRWFLWDPPHRIQSETIDPLLKALADYWRS